MLDIKGCGIVTVSFQYESQGMKADPEISPIGITVRNKNKDTYGSRYTRQDHRPHSCWLLNSTTYHKTEY